MSTIRFPVATSYHAGWTLLDLKGAPFNLGSATIDFAVYLSTDPLVGDPVPWMHKDNITRGGVVVTDAVNGVLRVDFASNDTVNLAGVYPWELRIQTPGHDWRQADRGFLVLLARRLDP